MRAEGDKKQHEIVFSGIRCFPTLITAVKIVLNLMMLLVYRTGSDGEFLGMGGTWNTIDGPLDMEIYASGVLVGFIIYNCAVLVSHCFCAGQYDGSAVDFLMNLFGIILFIGVGATCLHFWLSFHNELQLNSESLTRRDQLFGLSLGALCVLNTSVYILEFIISAVKFVRKYKHIRFQL